VEQSLLVQVQSPALKKNLVHILIMEAASTEITQTITSGEETYKKDDEIAPNLDSKIKVK
jgi:hypothetical protein